MNIQQLQYIVAVDEHRHFQRAAEACFITAATLSMMIKKMELELDVVIFDRSKQPVKPTAIGEMIIGKARTVLYHLKDLENSVKSDNEKVEGEVRLAIIPTLAPYFSHLFLPGMMNQYPNLQFKLYEWNTDYITDALVHDRLDVGIVATPLHRPELNEHRLFYEKLVAYSAEPKNTHTGEYLAPKDINLNRLWLLEEDHCLRSQVMNLCSLKRSQGTRLHLDFEAGSIETLINIVEMKEGITILPELAVHRLSEERRGNVKYFAEPVPVREISLITYRYFSKNKLLQALISEIQAAVAPLLANANTPHAVVPI